MSRVTTASTYTLPQIQGFLSSIRKLAADTPQQTSVSILTDEIERRVRDLVQWYEGQCEQTTALRADCKARNDEQIALRKRISSSLDAHAALTRDELEQSIRNELNK
jgi:hypothetical protein